MEYKTAYYKSKIEEFELKLSRSPDNSDAILNLARYYSYLGEYDSSRRMYEYYLRIKPGDEDVRFKYAQLLSWNNELCLAKDELIKLLEINPDKLQYQLLLANIGLWLDDDLEKSESLFQKVLSKNTGEKTALYGLAYVYLRNGKINEAEKYYGKLEKIENSTSNELVELESNILVAKKRNYSDMLYEILEKARKAVFENNCYIAIDEFNRYFEKGGTEQSVYFELANAYQCVNDYTSAINIYDDIIRSGQDDYDIVKQRAKIIYWSGDSLSAFREFKKLVDSHPEDAETRLYLGDCYFQLKQYQSAREIYNGLLNEAPGSHIIMSRLKWLGSAGVTSFSFDSFPTYMLLSPQGYHFTDNTGFRYNLFGAGFELGATDYLSVGLSGFRGFLSSDNRRLNFNNLKGALFLKLNEFIRFSLTAGQTYFTNNLNEIIIESSINIARKDIYTVSVFYNKMDAAFILFSPFLVENRLNAEHFGLSGDYSFNKGFLISGKYALIRVSDRNDGDQLQLRVGKKFDDNFKIGYEYYLFNFSERTELYWSPANFESHSVWSDVILFEDNEINFSIGGKLGLIPENDFLLRELNSQLDYKVTNSFNLRARFVTGSSSRAGAGYNSTSIQLSVFLGL